MVHGFLGGGQHPASPFSKGVMFSILYRGRGSYSRFSTWGHVLQTLFPKPNDGRPGVTSHPQCVCTASRFLCRAEQDSVAAEKLMSEMILEEQRSRVAREMQDQVLYPRT